MSGGKAQFGIFATTFLRITRPVVYGHVRAREASSVCASPVRLRTDRATNPAPRRHLGRVIRPRRQVVAVVSLYLMCLWVLVAPASALDPQKRITQYMYNAWTSREGSTANGGYAITQTADGFLWFVSGDLMTFDGVRFVPWNGPPNYGSISTSDSGFGQIMNAFGARAGALWVSGIGGIVRLDGRAVTSHFELPGLRSLQSMSEAPDGSLWIVRGDNRISDAPLCHVMERSVKCFGKADGVPISPIHSILADGKGGFWLGGQTALVHWRNGVSETYPIGALKSNGGRVGITSLALGSDGSVWVGIQSAGHGRGLGRLRNGSFQPFVTSGFDGSALNVQSMVFDRDSNLWVGTVGQGLFRINGDVVDHFGRAEGLSSDVVTAVFEDREGALWAVSTGSINRFRDPRVTSFSVLEGLGNLPSGVLATRDGTIWVACRGSLHRIGKNGAISSIRPRDGLPGNQVASMLEDHAGNLWVGVDDGLYLLKNGRFRRVPEPNDKPLGLVVGIAEDVDGNIWAECLSSPPKLVRIRDLQVREELPASRVPTGSTLAAGPRGGIWLGTLKGDLALLRNGVAEVFPLNAKGDPSIRQIAANGDGAPSLGGFDASLSVYISCWFRTVDAYLAPGFGRCPG
jgi:ligand-binding sensor domain-containing protein